MKFSTFLHLFLYVIPSLQKFGMGFLKAVCAHNVLISVDLHQIAFEIVRDNENDKFFEVLSFLFFFPHFSLILKEIQSYVSSENRHDYIVLKETFVLLSFLFFKCHSY